MRWLLEHPEVAQAARLQAARGDVFADAVLGDPTRLADLHRAGVDLVMRAEAPAGVTEELLRCSRKVTRRAERWRKDGRPGAEVLAGLTGLRDRDELGAALRDQLDGEGDGWNRPTLVHLARFVSQELQYLKPDGADHVVVTITDHGGPDGPDLGGEPRGGEPRGGEPGGEPTDPPPGGVDGRGEGGPGAVILESTEDPVASLLDQIAAAGGGVAVEFAQLHGVDADEARRLGAYHATQLSLGFQSTPVSDTTDPEGGRFWGTVLASLAMLVGGPVLAAAAYLFGVGFSSTSAGHAATAAVQQVSTFVHTHADRVRRLLPDQLPAVRPL